MTLNRRYKHAILGVVVVAVGAAGAMAYAENSEPAQDAVPISQAGVSMIQAIQAAEQHVSGRARRAEYENSKQGWVYEVEVVDGPRVFDVRVSAADGSVLSSAEDAPDREGREDHEGRERDKD